MSRTIIAVSGMETTSYEFRRRLVEIADELGLNADYLATVISFETGATFSPSERNPVSGCVGLIQFCGPAAVDAAKSAGLNYSSSEAQDWLSRMTPVEQLEYVKRYFKNVLKGRIGLSLTDTYMAVFSPAFIGKPESYVAYQEGQREYDQNSGFDRNPKDGKITVGEISSKISAIYFDGINRPRLPIGAPVTESGEYDSAPIPLFVFSIAVLAVGGVIGWGYGDVAVDFVRKQRWLSRAGSQ